MKRYAWFLVIPLLLTALLQSFQPAPTRTSASYSRNSLQVTIPYDAPRAGSGQLTVEVLSPDDAILGQLTQAVTVAQGNSRWHADVRLTKPVALDDLVWQRLRYRFTYSGAAQPELSGTESISGILRRPVMHVLADRTYIAGAPAAVRVVVTDSNNEPLTGSLHIALGDRTLFDGRLNRRGTASAEFRLPTGLTGASEIRYVAATAIGETEVKEAVQIQDKVSILLTTEKPIYQPGQTIHVRALALDRAAHNAAAARKLVFEIEDSRGNKVFKSATQTDNFGVASAEFTLADEVNLGAYHLRAVLDPGDNRAETTLNVDRYVLPKFKVALEFTGKARHGYRPGDHVMGVVHANYFFGKPVDRGEVTVKVTGMDVAQFEAASAGGKTDAAGDYRFDIRLPGYFAGKPIAGGAARALVEATVKDSAEHSESRGQPIVVSEFPLILTAIPEAGRVIPNLENEIFVLASYADGKPATAHLKVRAPGNAEQSADTEAGGVAMIRVAAGNQLRSLEVDAADREGNRAEATLPLDVRGGAEQVLLRADGAVYRVGDRIPLKVFSTRRRGSVYVDVVKDKQTILTRDIDLENGQAEASLTATAEMSGALDVTAYLFGSDAQAIADHRLVFVQPAGELKIQASTDRPEYKPGEDARIRFHVTNGRGEGVQAALGVQIVDEAVFALAEKQPGFAKVFFYLEQEALKPRYEIHAIDMPGAIDTDPADLARGRAARALFAATEIVNNNGFDTEAGRTLPLGKQWQYLQQYHDRLTADVTRLTPDLSRQFAATHDLTGAKLAYRDPWGGELSITRAGWSKDLYEVRSAGPDKRIGSADDISLFLSAETRKVSRAPRMQASTALHIEHDRGPAGTRAEVTGSAVDPAGGAIPLATLVLHERRSGAERRAHSDESGEFTFAAVPPGDYELRIEAPGFETLSRQFVLEARDRAVLNARLEVGGVAETVAVTAESALVKVVSARTGRGFGGGVAGGVIGGIAGAMPMAAPPAPQVMFEAALRSRNVVLADKAEPGGGGGAAPAPRVRSYFPEALYINPEIVTDGAGNASILVPLADSITTWRMALMASTTHGALGSTTGSIKVFQDFFTDLDLPVTLTQGDRISLPIAVYNYSGQAGEVGLRLEPADWYRLVEDTPEKSLAVESGHVGGSHFTIEAARIGKFKLTLTAAMKGGARRADVVVREIEVVPNGREQTMAFNGRLENTVHHQVNFPADAIPDAEKIFVRLYPGPLSQIVEGMDAILRMPFGCFEQTSSATYPNVLALDYMKRIKKLTPEVHAKAEGFIANGYQRLLTFEVPGGGFSWFGQAPANKILTSYGLMEFSDMSKVHDVDERLIQRTQQWLAAQQQPDGSWKPDTNFINEGATNRYNADVLRITAYIAWALENTGYRGPAADRARGYIEKHMGEKADPYTLAVIANFAADSSADRAFKNQAIQQLLAARTEKDDQAWWTSAETGMYATGASAAVETTGLAVQALLKTGEGSGTARKALNYIAAKKDASGTWGTTQATIMALRALLLSTEKGASDVRGNVEITLNGKAVDHFTLTAENNDLYRQFVLGSVNARGANDVGIRFEGRGGLAYQVAGRYFIPWATQPSAEPLSIDVEYDRTRLAQDDIATATAKVTSHLPQSAKMLMVDLGIPPGFDLLSEDLQAYQEKSGRLKKFSLTPTQAILYFDAIGPNETITLHYRLRAKYPIRVKTFASHAYEYYAPEIRATARPVQLEVSARR